MRVFIHRRTVALLALTGALALTPTAQAGERREAPRHDRARVSLLVRIEDSLRRAVVALLGEAGSNLTGEAGSNVSGEAGSNLASSDRMTGEAGSNATGEAGSN